jgi:hypothetical protein
MKKIFITYSCIVIQMLFLFINQAEAQSPAQISYQAILRDAGGAAISDSYKAFKFSILQGSPTGTTVYWEIQAVTTNSFGLVNLKIGSVRPGIETIDWSAGPYYLKVEVDAVEMGTTQIISVPYALYAQKAGNGFSGSYNDLTGKPDLSGYLQNETDPVFNASSAKTISSSNINNWNSAFTWGNHASAGYLTSQISHNNVVIDEDFASNGILKRTASGVYGIVTDNSSDWNTAFGWGDHSTKGYLKTETDPVFNASASKTITTSDKTNWNNAFGWGDHSLQGYLKTETDPVFTASTANTITLTDKTNWNSAFGWGNHASAGYLTSQITHSDVLVDGDFTSNGIMKRTASGVYAILTDNSTDWNTAFGWGNHSLQGYLKNETDPVFNASASKAITISDINNWNTVKWTRTDDSLYYIKGNVGVGTKDPRSTLTVAGTTPTDSAIFEVKNNNGITVFAVYNNGVKITLDETAKGATKGGFAIGGFSPVKGVNRDYMKVTGDSIRLYLDNKAPAKGATKGGFAIGGFDATKGITGRYMNITTDAGTTSGFNTFLGYKAGGLQSGGANNIAIGRYAGYNLNLATWLIGKNNIFIGDSAGYINSSGYQNIYIGRYAGAGASDGYHNVYIGFKAGSEGYGQYNTFIGDEAGRYNHNGWSNVFMGNSSGRSITSGHQNTLIGTQSGWKLGTGSENTFVGSTTGFEAINTSGNTFIGASAGDMNVSGNNNLFIGKWSGQQSTGSNNIFIGANSGSNITSGDNMLIIDNTPSSIYTAFIAGDMLNDKMMLGADVGVHAYAPDGDAFYVYGKAENTGGWFTISDARKKTNIREITDPLMKVAALRGVKFDWKDPVGSETGSQIGFIAQETLKVLPEVVSTSGDYYSIQYAPITALLVEAIKELKKENEDLKEKLKQIDELRTRIEELTSIVKPEGTR